MHPSVLKLEDHSNISVLIILSCHHREKSKAILSRTKTRNTTNESYFWLNKRAITRIRTYKSKSTVYVTNRAIYEKSHLFLDKSIEFARKKNQRLPKHKRYHVRTHRGASTKYVISETLCFIWEKGVAPPILYTYKFIRLK
jgi:hypothetical protein